jgi:hypothetical protein
MAANTAPQVGLFILSIELRRLGVSTMESIIFWVTQAVSISKFKNVTSMQLYSSLAPLVFTFVSAAIGIGFTV